MIFSYLLLQSKEINFVKIKWGGLDEKHAVVTGQSWELA
jgi:hypothetical protein